MAPRFNLTTVALLAILTVFATKTLAVHFRGGSISWRPVGGKKVEFFYKVGFTYGLGAGCDEKKIGNFVQEPLNKGGDKDSAWKCTQGCTGTPVLHPMTYICMAANKKEEWEQGQMRFNYTFSDSGPFVAAYEGGDWMKLGSNKGAGDWSIATTVDLRSRNDTNMANRSPKTLSLALYFKQYDCHHELRIPVIDPDGDKVMCHWAVSNECVSVCNGLPGATLDEDKCTITFDSMSQKQYVDGETYGVALTIRDYPQTTITLDGKVTKTPSDSLSRVPLQFLIKTPTFNVACDVKPRFVNPTPPEGGVVIVHAEDLLSLVIAADNDKDDKKEIESMVVMGPIGLKQSPLTPDSSRHNTFQKDVTWQTSQMDIGEHIACATAVNERGKSSDPRCFTIKIVPDPCDNSPCLNGATCESKEGKFTCKCVPGYTGTLCETDIDDCSNPNPCKNGGICHDLINDFSCTCVAGYTEKDCSTDIDDCSNPNPCENGGTCHDLVNDYRCTCVAGYTDKRCSTDIDDCINPNSCLNGGTCHDLVNDFGCTCVSGYTDKDCSTDIDDCSKPNPCQNGGICHDLVNDYRCTCVPGYNDKNCSTDIDDCSNPNTCQNGGTCHDLVNDYMCNCVPGYTDKNCSTDIDDCINPNPCLNGGTCHDLVHDFGCTCVSGYTDKDCSTDIDDCSKPNPCQNGGICHDLVNDYRCTCVPGYDDKDCSTDIDDCSNPNTCQNGGTCHDLVNDYMCNCVPGYTDKNCSTDIDDCINPNSCLNGGTCHDLVHDFGCTCVSGYTDKDRSTDIDDCSNPNPCQNGGICHDLVNDYRCTCVPGYDDKDCSTDIDDCSNPNTCQNGGTCHDLVNDYMCICVPGYTDKNCSTDIDECVSDPCLHGGNCTDLVNDFSCACHPGYTGKICQIGVDFCEPKPCANDGVCQNSLKGFTCQCVDGWHGKTCDYRFANSKSPFHRSKGSKCKSSAPGQVTTYDACCQATEYNDCQCFISPHVEAEEIEMDQTTRDVLCGLIGFPLGLALSVLTFLLFRWCASRACVTETVQRYRANHRRTRRTQSWIDDQMPPVELSTRRSNDHPYSRFHKTRPTPHPSKNRGTMAGW